MLIDTHTHIFEPEFDADRAEVVQRAHEKGVDKFLLPNIDASTIQRLKDCQQAFPEECSIMMGVHPTSVNETYQDELAIFDREMEHPENFVAVGEIGLDLYWDKTFLKEQKTVFEHQVGVSIELNLPISIHCREAFAEVADSLSKFNPADLRGVFHCFTGTPDLAHQIFKLGNFCLGVGGPSTYKNAKFTALLPQIPLDRIVLETDAPYLTPVPFRGKRNEPAFVYYVAQNLATVYGCSFEELSEQTTNNAKQLFLR